MRTHWGALLLLATSGCSVLVDSELGKGIGESCTTDDECHAAGCVDGLCTTTCRAAADCPEPSVCTAAGMCELPLRVGLVYVGVPEDEGWTLTHEEGRKYAMAHLPYLESDFVTNAFMPADALAATDQFIAGGDQVVVGTSFSLREPMTTAATTYPNTQFLTCSGNVHTANHGSYFGRMEQAYHLAGYAAAHVTTARRLGFLGSFVTPEVVRHVNAFTRGARRHDPSIVVEVRWEGFWFDTDEPDAQGKYDETVLTEALLDAGADVIAHNMDNGRALAAVEARKQETGDPLFSIGNDNRDACNRGPTSCIGTSYWNWGPMYVRLFDAIHRGAWDPFEVINDNIQSNPEQSIPNFSVNVAVGGNDLAIAVSELLADMAKPGNEHKAFEVFAGESQYCSTGQRDPLCVQAGEQVDDEELRTMCWFVDGVVEKTNPDLVTSPDRPALVPQPLCDTQQ
jgi:basic membrane lipoprotein Med (substrate-binding protein (PBP1-ABC) superfamily)